MTEQLKDLIANAPHKDVGIFTALMFVSNGKYDGFWGENGYDNLIILGYEIVSKEWVLITDYGDVFFLPIYNLKSTQFSVDTK